MIWYVDVGLGDALHDPVPLAAGDAPAGPVHAVARTRPTTASATGTSRMIPLGTFAGMSWRAAAGDDRRVRRAPPVALDLPRLGVRPHRDAHNAATPCGVDIMRGLVLTRVGEGSAPADPLTERNDWFGALADLFDLRFEGVPPEMLDRLWARCSAAHEEAEAASILGDE